jgi:peptidoglycan/LPS O-acetylase OafA/YrhL
MSVLAIIAFHSGLNSVPGGYYGVDSFFVLSGFLITSLLVKEWGTSGTIRLRRFWAGRARRLLPALFFMVAVLGFVLAVWPQVLATPHVVGDAIAAVFYASNWYSVASSATYFSLSAQPSPLLHTWSLAIEEQFYLIWPLVVLAVLKLGTRGRRVARSRAVPVVGGGELVLQARDPAWTRRRRLHVLFAVACLGSLASAITMAALAPSGYTTRAYYGTDTRAQALLVGAAIAIGLTIWREGSRRPLFVRTAAVLGLAGIVGTGALWATTAETSTFAFCGGFLVASLAAGAVVLGVVAAPRSLTVRLLELPPLPQWGRISYGIYLWYWPVLLVMSGSRLHWGVYQLFLARVAVTVGIAALSYRFIEMPIRRGGVLRHWRSVVAAPAGAALAIGAVFASTLVPVGASVLAGGPVGGHGGTAEGAALAGRAAATTAAVSPLEPALPITDLSRRVKVLLVGDSIAGSLGVGLAPDAAALGIRLVNAGIPGCSLATQGQIKVLWYTLPPGGPCAQSGAGSLFATWQRWIDQYNPDVVLYVGRGETFDQDLGGQWQNLGQPSFDHYVARRLRQAVGILGSRGATVVLLTTPYYDSGLSPSGAPWPEDALVRAQIDNGMIRTVAASMTTGSPSGRGASAAAGANATGARAADGASASTVGNPVAGGSPVGGNKVYVYDLNEVVSPGGGYAANEGGVNVRCGDGVHFSPSGGMFVGAQLLPDLAKLGQVHAADSLGGSWPGRLPPSTPSWYEKLPCP